MGTNSNSGIPSHSSPAGGVVSGRKEKTMSITYVRVVESEIINTARLTTRLSGKLAFDAPYSVGHMSLL
jgi:hypothetical protein